MRKSIYFKNFATMAFVLLLSFLILGSSFSALSYRFLMNEKRNAMVSTAVDVSNAIAAYSYDVSLGGFEIHMALSIWSNLTGYHILVSSVDGMVISCSDNKLPCEHTGKIIPPEILSSISAYVHYSELSLLGGIYTSTQNTIGLEVRGRFGEVIGYTFISANADDMSGVWRQFSGIFLTVASIVMIFAFIVSLITTRQQTKPINEMAAAAHRFARGDFSKRIEPTGRDDEIEYLAKAFNSMADYLERSETLRREFIANVSHELKTPMTTISGFADGILDGTVPSEKQSDYIQVISSETHRLSRLVMGMLDMSQFQATDPEELLKESFDASEVIRLALLSLEQKITDRGLDVEVDLPEEPIVTRGSQDAITQVIYNLIDNAIKFSQEGSAIRIDIWKQEGRAHISVESKGETIPADELPLIFDRFHKTDHSRSSDRSGVGLGLYIVKTILDNHNEDIFVTSQDGVTTFEFTLTIV